MSSTVTKILHNGIYMIPKESLPTSLFQREEINPSLAKRGEGRFSDQMSIQFLGN
jgi:hypothetical protein